MSIILILIRWLIMTAAILLSSALVPGIYVNSLSAAFLSAVLLGLINTFIRPLLIILTLPLHMITLGLFYFVLNAFLLKMVAYFVNGFEVRSFSAAFLAALVISLVGWLVNVFIGRAKNEPKKPEKPDYIDLSPKGNGKWE